MVVEKKDKSIGSLVKWVRQCLRTGSVITKCDRDKVDVGFINMWFKMTSF